MSIRKIGEKSGKRAWIAVAVGALALGGCGKRSDAPESKASGRVGVPVESTTVPTTGATVGAGGAGSTPSPNGALPTASSEAATAVPTGRRRVLILGTSLTAGYGLDNPQRDAYPAVLQQIADSLGVAAEVIGAGLSGETSAGALRRADWVLNQPVDLFVLETGANDGLRGLNPDSTAANLRAIIAKVRTSHPAARIALVQMEAPTNMGAAYTRSFHAVFGAVAAQEKVTLLPFLLAGVAGDKALNQGDGIHPTPEGARRAARNLWPMLRTLIATR
ncbi:MAG: arylesterase [Gemmatimonadetes bacterium]|nr:arylesterase [Gemmatimonadota bacterium]